MGSDTNSHIPFIKFLFTFPPFKQENFPKISEVMCPRHFREKISAHQGKIEGRIYSENEREKEIILDEVLGQIYSFCLTLKVCKVPIVSFGIIGGYIYLSLIRLETWGDTRL